MSDNLDAFTRAYIAAALWSTTDNADDYGGEPIDHNYDESDIAPETLAEMLADCADFQRDCLTLLQAAHETGRYGSGGSYDAEDVRGDGWYSTAELAGHDFWLTRNGHGAGFWDRGLGKIGDGLTAAAKTYSGIDLYVGDDGKIYA